MLRCSMTKHTEKLRAFPSRTRATTTTVGSPAPRGRPPRDARRSTMPKLNVNGTVREHDAEPETPLLWVLREQLGLTGSKYGCGVAQCGACTVHIDGVAVRSCVMPVSAVQAASKVVTIEGLSRDGSHPLQKAWVCLLYTSD